MGTKIIPFDLETAKKIQAGEIEGRIKTIDKHNVRIVCSDRMDAETPILFLVQFNDWEGVFECNLKGEYVEGYGDDARLMPLVLEVPDNEPQFKPFDKVLVRNKSDERWHPSLYATTDGLLYYTIDCKNWQQCITYEENQELVGTTDKPKED